MNPPFQFLFLFLSIVIISVFTFVSIAVWVEGQRKEREAYYKTESLRRIAEMPGESAKYVLELMREERQTAAALELQKEFKKHEGLKIGGAVNIAVGVALMIFLYSLGGKNSPYLVGLIPGFIGLALIASAFLVKKAQPPAV